jgi:hypothetical protein
MNLGDAGLIAQVEQTVDQAPDAAPGTPGADRDETDTNLVEPPRLRSIASPLSVGMYAGKWCSFTATPDLPTDQRDEDGGSLNFDSLPLDEPLELLGAPVVELSITSDQPVAMVAVRLSDRLPDDRTTRVTYGLLNLCHRDSHEDPKPLEPGETYKVQVQLNEVAHRFPARHRLRLQVSTSYWPVAWPAPRPVRLTVDPAESRLLLPVRAPRPDEDDALQGFGDPEVTEAPRRTTVEERDYGWTVTRDLISREAVLETRKDEGAYRLDDIDLEVHSSTIERYSHRDEDPTSVRGEVEAVRRFVRGEWQVETQTRTLLTCTEDEFVIQAELDAYEGETRVVARSWHRRIPRELL